MNVIVRCGERDEAAARATVEQDWRSAVAEQPWRPSAPTGKGEREGGDGLPYKSDVISREAFVESLSELVDAWAVGTSGDEYQSFLRTLFLNITWQAERTEGGAGGAAAMEQGGVRRDSARRGGAGVERRGGAGGATAMQRGRVRRNSARRSGAGRAGGDAEAADGGPANRRPMRPLPEVRSSDEQPSPEDADEGGYVGRLLGLLIRDPVAADAAAAAARAHSAAQLAAADAAAAAEAAASQAAAEAAAAAAELPLPLRRSSSARPRHETERAPP